MLNFRVGAIIRNPGALKPTPLSSLQTKFEPKPSENPNVGALEYGFWGFPPNPILMIQAPTLTLNPKPKPSDLKEAQRTTPKLSCPGGRVSFIDWSFGKPYPFSNS